MRVVSFFSGCGGLDLGFEQSGIHVVWANELEPSCRDTYTINHPNTKFVLGDINTVNPDEIPDCDGFIGGPPCQSWSVAGKQRGLDDPKGVLFRTYIRLIGLKKPKFFLIENVKGILDEKFKAAFDGFISDLGDAGYDVNWALLDTAMYGVPQNRERVFFIGFRKDLKINYSFPKPYSNSDCTLYDAISDIKIAPVFYRNNEPVKENAIFSNHDVIDAEFSAFYNRGNRRRLWNKPSFTIHATAENIPLHPSSPKMLYWGHEDWKFQMDKLSYYRRLSVRECARIQTFPDSFHFIYSNIKDGYRMIGNAVPPLMGKVLAQSILSAFQNQVEHQRPIIKQAPFKTCVLIGYYKTKLQYDKVLSNLLYYVRSDKRCGSMYKDDFEVSPQYLLLHDTKEAKLYELTGDESLLVDASYLVNLGFEVSGDKYLCFKLKSSRPVNIDGYDTQHFTGNVDLNKYAPYIMDIHDILKKIDNKQTNSTVNPFMPLKFIDLFAGLGGFHFALEELKCECVFASELKEDLQKLYKINFPNSNINGDITKIDPHDIPAHDILCAGFPCQPFSQAGKRQGFDDEKDRGNLFNYICNILKVHRPRYIILENVSNLKGHDEGNTWKTIYHKLSDPIDKGGLNYEVRHEILSPHQYGIPQHRRRIYIVCEDRDKGCLENFKFPLIKKGRECDITKMIDENDLDYVSLKGDTRHQLDVWQHFIDLCVSHNTAIPSFPIWAMEWGATYNYKEVAPAYQSVNELHKSLGKLGQKVLGSTIQECLSCLPVYSQTDKNKKFPDWKIKYIQQNREFFEKNKDWLTPWLDEIRDFENSHLKMEWNCGPKATPTLKDKIIQFRASGIRVKLATYSPALNLVGTQIPIFPWVKLPTSKVKDGEPTEGRYMSRHEAALIQGMKKLKFGNDEYQLSTSRSYAALGNAVNVTIVKHIAKKLLCL